MPGTLLKQRNALVDQSWINSIIAIWRESLSLLIIVGLSYFSLNRMKRVDHLSDARVADASEMAKAMADVEKETVRALDGLKAILLSQRNSGT